MGLSTKWTSRERLHDQASDIQRERDRRRQRLRKDSKTTMSHSAGNVETCVDQWEGAQGFWFRRRPWTGHRSDRPRSTSSSPATSRNRHARGRCTGSDGAVGSRTPPRSVACSFASHAPPSSSSSPSSARDSPRPTTVSGPLSDVSPNTPSPP